MKITCSTLEYNENFLQGIDLAYSQPSATQLIKTISFVVHDTNLLPDLYALKNFFAQCLQEYPNIPIEFYDNELLFETFSNPMTLTYHVVNKDDPKNIAYQVALESDLS